MSSKLFSDLEVVKSMLERESLFSYVFKILLISLQFISSKIAASSPISKKDKKIVIFTNLYYTGNPRAVYERMLEDSKLREKYEIYWMAPQLSTFFELRKKKLPVLYKHGLLSVKKYMNADLWVLAHKGAWNVPVFLQSKFRKLRKIQIEHGVGPKASMTPPEEYMEYDAWCVSSEEIKKRHVELWNAPPDRLFATGYPRIDTLLEYLKKPRKVLWEKLRVDIKYDKLVLWAPTFDMGLWPWGNPYEGIERLARWLAQKNVFLVVRPHPYTMYNKKKVKRILNKYPNTKFMSMDVFSDTMWLLAATDILITDWSSIYTEFMVTGRPIIFVDHNEDFFIQERGKPEVPPELRPGMHVRSEDELFNGLEAILQGEYVEDRELYQKSLKFIHGVPDGHYSDRVIELINTLLEG